MLRAYYLRVHLLLIFIITRKDLVMHGLYLLMNASLNLDMSPIFMTWKVHTNLTAIRILITLYGMF